MITAITAHNKTHEALQEHTDQLENLCIKAIDNAIYHGNFSCFVNTSNYLSSSIDEVIDKLRYFGYATREKHNLLYINWEDPE